MPELYARYCNSPTRPGSRERMRSTMRPRICSSRCRAGCCSSRSWRRSRRTSRSSSRSSPRGRKKATCACVVYRGRAKRLVDAQGFDAALMQRSPESSSPFRPCASTRRHPRDLDPDARPARGDAFLPAADLLDRRPERAAAFPWPGNLEDLAAAVRTLALTSLEEEIESATPNACCRSFARRAAEAEVSFDLPLREARERSSGPTSSTNLAQANGFDRAPGRAQRLERTHLYRKAEGARILGRRKEE